MATRKQPKQEVNFCITPSLLDSFLFYKRSADYMDSEEAFKELINKINRVPFNPTPQIERGVHLQALVNGILYQRPKDVFRGNEQAQIFDKVVPMSIINDIVQPLYGSIMDWYVEAPMKTKFGIVMLYGEVDYLNGPTVFDLKYCEGYELGKYYHHTQRLVYPYCLMHRGIDVHTFEFRATDLKSVFPESYTIAPSEDETILRSIVEDFIDFIVKNRQEIKSKKLFNKGEDRESGRDLVPSMLLE